MFATIGDALISIGLVAVAYAFVLILLRCWRIVQANRIYDEERLRHQDYMREIRRQR